MPELHLTSYPVLFFRNVNDVWLGYSDIRREGHWVWTNPAAKCNRFTKWRRGEPNGKRNENCGAMYKSWNGEWNDVGCDRKYSFVCEIGAVAAKLCPIQTFSFQYQGLRYQLVQNKMTWNQAENHCRAKKGHLVTVTSQRMDNDLLQTMRKR